MEIEIKEIDTCKLDVTYYADAGEILEKRGEVLKNFRKAPVPGCRPGRASIDAIKIHYRSQIEDSLKRALAEDAYHNTVFEKRLRPHGPPVIKSAMMVDRGFKCEFEVNVKPDFELGEYRDFEIPKPHIDMSLTDLTEKMMQQLRVKYGESIPYDEEDFVQVGDNVILNYDGFVDGEKVDNISAEGEMLTVGSSQLQDFDNSLLGMAMGEVREFDLVVPEGGLASLAGKTLHFSATLIMGSKQVPAALDDELAHKLGKKDFAELKEFVTNTATSRYQQMEHSKLTEFVANKLVENHEFDVPNWLVLSEAQYLAHNSKANWEALADLDKEQYMKLATRNVKASLILDRVREDEPEAQLSDEEMFEIVKQEVLRSGSQASPDEMIQEMNRTGYLQILFARLKDEYTLDFVVKTSTVTE